MSRYNSYINTAAGLLRDYPGGGPFSLYLKQYFRSHAKHGGNDRKAIARLCYSFFRAGAVFTSLPLPQQLMAGYYLLADAPDALTESLCPQWAFHSGRADKIREVDPSLSLEDFFSLLLPEHISLSEGIDRTAFCSSLLVQPGFFLRIRPGRGPFVLQQLEKAEIRYQSVEEGCLALAPGIPLDDQLTPDRDVVVQDLSSQRIASLLPSFDTGGAVQVWDCCAASGGKSLLAIDRYPSIELTVSDIREQILENLSRRFQRAGFGRYRKIIADLGGPVPPVAGAGYDLVMADVPCSGSGTWSRTPEQRYLFREQALTEYIRLQQRILLNVIPSVKKGGYLLYSTCSAFAGENEAQVQFIREHSALTLERMEVLKGYEEGADTMFAAVFIA